MHTLTWHRFSDQPDELGESPFFHPLDQQLYWVDVAGRQLRRAPLATGQVQSWAMPSEPGCIAPTRSGGLVIALRDGIYHAPAWGASLVQIAPALHDPATTRFNDGKADPLGRFWAGTRCESRGRSDAALYCYAQGQLRRLVGDAHTANGLAFSPDLRTLYWADTSAHRIQAWDWEARANQLTHPHVFHQFAPKPADWTPADTSYAGRPDGAAIDSQGNYWCAMYEGGRLMQLAPDGRVLQDFPVPARCPTMPCFGGEDLCTLYLTTARAGRSAQELAALPLSGHVLWTRVEVPGRPVDTVED